MNEAKKKSNLLGLIVLFVVFTIIGIAISYFYIMFQVNAHDIWLNIIANFVFGLALAATVWIIKRLMRITNDVMSFVLVVLSLAVIMYVMWNMWFVLMLEMLYRFRDVEVLSDAGRILSYTREMLGESGYFIGRLRYFNERGTWSLNGNQWSGLILAAVWAGEMLVMAVFPLMAAYASVGLYLAEQGAWVQEKLMNYGFSAFDDYELDRLASGDIDVILEKPLETRGEAMNAVAVCYHRGEPTEFIALYKADWDRDGTLSKGRHIMTVKLGIEKIDALDVGLQAVHYPTVADKIAKESEFENSIKADTMDPDKTTETFEAAGVANQEATVDAIVKEVNSDVESAISSEAQQDESSETAEVKPDEAMGVKPVAQTAEHE